MTGMTGLQGPRSADEIPGPKGYPVIGNMFDIPAGRTIQTLMDLTRQYGPMLRLQTPFGDRFIVSGLAEIDQLCDDARFDKFVGVSQKIIRELRPSAGLFTADTDDPEWQQAHNILLPNFSQQAMQGYLPMMIDIADQLMQKWDRLNPGESVDVTADMTRLTLDTIALCGFGYRFNSFYREDQHPFVEAMLGMLTESQTQSRQLKVQRAMRRRAARKMDADVAYMESVVADIIAERRKAGDAADHQDLLSCMLEGVDKRSGRKLSDANIIAQCNTFLVAGHETTSGLLSFAVAYLLKAPDVVAKAHEEVDRVLGTDLAVTPTYQQVQGLTYVTQILNEILRLWPTAPAFTRYPYEDVVLGGYTIAKGTSLTALTPMLHRIPEIWGADAEEFNPDHFRPETRAAVPPNAFRPFGAGQRACIGRQFAMQEAVLVLGMLLQRFELVDTFDYHLKIKEALTLKPEDLRITLRPRAGRTTGTTPAPPQVTGGTTRSERPAPRLLPLADRHNTPLMVLFGSNLGTAEGIATRIAQDGTERGFAVTLGSLDDHTGELPHSGALVVVCASYNGQPPDNAERFCRWIQAPDTAADAADGLAFAVFGCGNMDWASTYQAVPTLIDTQLEARGGRRMYPRGEGDARSDFDGQYQQWYAELWPSVHKALDIEDESPDAAGTTVRLHVTMTNRQTSNPLVMSYRAAPATVLVNRELNTSTNGALERSARHVEIALPAGLEYATGDHLGVLPRNGVDVIRRVIAKFGLDAGTYLTITQSGSPYTHLPLDEPAPLLGILGSCVELQDVATRSDIAVLAEYTADPVQRAELLGLSVLDDEGQARYRKRVAARRATLLDLLDEYPSCDLPFNVYLDLLPPLRPRFYSISSAPAVSKSCDITVGVLSGPARGGNGTFTGVCSGHLNQSGAESTVFVFVRKPRIPFRPPENPHLPMIMVGAGTGMAPFRGFLQERAALKERGVPVAESMLFFGCRNPESDFLYADELRGYEKAGVTQLSMAFSRAEGEPKRYVQHAIDAERDRVWDLLEQGAVVYVCGNAGTMAPGVRAALTEIYRAKTGASEAESDAWLGDLRATDRYLEDIWGETAVG